MPKMKTVTVQPKILALCFVKSERAESLTRDETQALMDWCDCQQESLWDHMTLQEILNVYRATAEYDTFEGWAEENRKAAHEAWNRAVIDPGNRMASLR